jgi:hypothetical protein
MHKFKVGQVVRCVSRNGPLEPGKLYRIDVLKPTREDTQPRYHVTDVMTNEKHWGENSNGFGWRERRFEPL